MHAQSSFWQSAETVPNDLIELGSIVGAYGVRGWFKVKPYTSSGTLLTTKQWWLKCPKKPAAGLLSILSAKSHTHSVVACAQYISEREMAEELRGCSVWISRAAFPVLPEGEYYWADLIGLMAFNLQQQLLGRVVGLLDNGVHSILRLAYAEIKKSGVEVTQERLVPFVDAYISGVDWSEKKIYIDWQLDY